MSIAFLRTAKGRIVYHRKHHAICMRDAERIAMKALNVAEPTWADWLLMNEIATMYTRNACRLRYELMNTEVNDNQIFIDMVTAQNILAAQQATQFLRDLRALYADIGNYASWVPYVGAMAQGVSAGIQAYEKWLQPRVPLIRWNETWRKWEVVGQF